MRLLPVLAGALVLASSVHSQQSGFQRDLASAERALAAGDLAEAHARVDRALERDPNALAAWALLERVAEAGKETDERVYALHRQVALARAQRAGKDVLAALTRRLATLDPVAVRVTAMRAKFVDRLVEIADAYEKSTRPHSAIGALKQALALDPDRADLATRIEKIAESPDPSLAEDARPADLLEGVSAEWIAEHDAEHATWKDRAKLEKPNYVTYTDAGYEVLVRAGEAMEQMNAFYRQFFRYGDGEDKRNPSRIELRIFKDKDEYLKLGSSPAEWSGGQFTGSAVETFIGAGGFEGMTGTLFHEAAHQFVSLATSASGWLNEGVASFFEGTRILANGTVVMNLPASGRLFPLAGRMEAGWMADADDGIDPSDPNVTPSKSPTFRIVLEDRYEWGPPWYAPTWGVVYFLFNYQDPVDGRYVYRKAFGDYLNASGGKSGETAIKTFEEVVLGHPEPVTPGLVTGLKLPETVDELEPIWKDFILSVRDRQSGRDKSPLPYKQWAQHARKRKALADADESFERAFQEDSRDTDLLVDYAEHLIETGKTDRGVRMLRRAASLLELSGTVDRQRLQDIDARLAKVDPNHKRLARLRRELVDEAAAVIGAYREAGLELMAMEVSSRLALELGEPSLLEGYEAAVRATGRSLARWRLVYDEQSLEGWNSSGQEKTFEPQGPLLTAHFGEYDASSALYSVMSLDEVTSGDYSFEAEVLARHGENVFAGIVFGKKSASDFHALVTYPPKPGNNGFVNLVTFYGAGANDTWRRSPVPDKGEDPERSSAGLGSAPPTKLRVDVTGRTADVWIDGQFVATQEFPSLDVLRGGFGLLIGPGTAAFRNVRLLARPARDPSAAIERSLWLESGGASAEQTGSFMGVVPPWPAVEEWLVGQRASWQEELGHPQLLVLWSIDQNDAVQIDTWLANLAKRHADVGLAIVNVASAWDVERIADYLRTHEFPGVIALDSLTDGQGIGTTFERFDVARFHLPRLVLLDIDGKVAWEGDPGFSKGQPWKGQEALLDAPLRDLIARQKLPELMAWKQDWPAAREALARGEVAVALPALRAALPFDPRATPEVDEAQLALAKLEDAIRGIDTFIETLAAAEREPAFDVALEWAEVLGLEVTRTKTVKAVAKAASVSGWKRAQAALKPLTGKLKSGKVPDDLEEILAKVEGMPGTFPAELATHLRAAAAEGAEALRAAVEAAPELPAHWLATEYFHW
jgi:tetratricopeptide (TPR) repeat protein